MLFGLGLPFYLQKTGPLEAKTLRLWVSSGFALVFAVTLFINTKPF